MVRRALGAPTYLVAVSRRTWLGLQSLQHRGRVAVNHVEQNQRCAAGCAVATFPVAQRGNRESEARRKLLLRQAQALAQAGYIHRLRGVQLDSRGFAFGFGMGNCLDEALLDAFECFCHGEIFQVSSQM